MQWTARRIDFCTLTQRFGRAARDPATHGIGLLLAEPACFKADDEEENKLRGKRKQKRKLTQRKRARVDGHVEQTSQQEAQSQNQAGANSDEDEDEDEDEDDDDDDDDDDGGDEIMREVDTEARAGNSQPEPIDFEALWVEYQSWSNDHPKATSKKKGFSGYEPALRDLLGVRKPTINCRRTSSRVYYAPSKELGKFLACRYNVTFD